MRFVFVAILSVALFATTFGRPHCCDENKVFQFCGSACPDTCDSLELDEPVACVDVCVRGCFCREGYVLDPENHCVEPVDCPNNATTYGY